MKVEKLGITLFVDDEKLESAYPIYVSLNGARIKDCVLADDSEGYALRLVRNKKGLMESDPDSKYLSKVERIEGKIVIHAGQKQERSQASRETSGESTIEETECPIPDWDEV
jgi:hypothetical protein